MGASIDGNQRQSCLLVYSLHRQGRFQRNLNYVLWSYALVYLTLQGMMHVVA
jgi:hypothetical protein